MKKTNKTYHLEQSATSKISNSPGRIVKNQPKSTKQKLSQKHNGSISHSRKEDFYQINKKTQERLEKNQNSKKHQKSLEQHKDSVHYLGQKHQPSVERSSGLLKQEIGANPYQQIYHNDMKYFQEYLHSTAKYEYNGINLNWPYYFTKNNFQTN